MKATERQGGDADLVRTDRPYLVMGLLDTESIAWAIGEGIRGRGGRVIYVAQSERMARVFLERDDGMTAEHRAALDLRYCDVTQADEVTALFDGLEPLAGVVHSIAYANPRTCLGEEFHTDAIEDVLQSFHISCASLATVTRQAVSRMDGGGSLLALTFDTSRVYPFYNWMGVNKAALEALVRALARRHGRDLVNVNALSAGPLFSKAASRIPGFGRLDRLWNASSPLPWDPIEGKQEVANAAAFLLGPMARRVTGQVLYVDGGASVVAGELLSHERDTSRSEGDASASSNRSSR